jgi:hypothetical protein
VAFARHLLGVFMVASTVAIVIQAVRREPAHRDAAAVGSRGVATLSMAVPAAWGPQRPFEERKAAEPLSADIGYGARLPLGLSVVRGGRGG